MKLPVLTEDQVEYFANNIAKEPKLLETLLILLKFETRKEPLTKMGLSKELKVSQIPMEKITSKLEGMTLINPQKLKSLRMPQYLNLSHNGQTVVKNLVEKSIIRIHG